MSYKNFKTAIYCTTHDIMNISSLKTFSEQMDNILKHMHIDKMYLDTVRSEEMVDESKIRGIRQYYESRGIKTAGGITLNALFNGDFKSFCYSEQEYIDKVKKIITFTADLFDEIILDDFFFTNCKCENCISKKGDRSWTDFRLSQHEVVSRIILDTAKNINPNINMIIKYPNWYEDYQTTGYNLEKSSQIFDETYTGTEVRDSKHTQQNLQPYLSYFLMRYLENVKPGKNGGGWFDTLDCVYNPNRFIEQINLTLLSKAKEATVFSLGSLLYYHDLFIPIAGHVYKKMDNVLGKLGECTGISCYKPYHSQGEDYLHNFIGMIGLPLEPKPYFDTSSKTILLTESSSYDDVLMAKAKKHLINGNNIIVTSGLIKKLSSDDCCSIHELIEIDYSDKKILVDTIAYKKDVCSYSNYERINKNILLPQLKYSTNDVWEEVCGISEELSYPILLKAQYGSETIFILTVPDNFSDLYLIPQGAINYMRDLFMDDFKIKLHCPAKISLFLYNNNTFSIQSFLNHKSYVDVVIEGENKTVTDIITNKEVTGINIKNETHIKMLVDARQNKIFKLAESN